MGNIEVDIEALELKYQSNKIENYKLRTIKDIEICHNINAKKILGYSKLDDENKKLFEKFIVNFYNSYSPAVRDTLTPKCVFIALQTQKINKNGEVSFLTENITDKTKSEFVSISSIALKKGDYEYLRFEYERDASLIWLHIFLEDEFW